MRILAIDIETAPNLAHVWQLWGEQHIGLNQLMESGEVLCFAAKWVGEEGDVLFFSTFHHGKGRMVEAAHRLLDEADVVIHWNGKRFDVPWLNSEILLAGLAPPAPFKQLDLLDTVRSRFRFPSNKLDYVSNALGLAGKVKHEGHDLWVKCMAGDADAWGRMQAYNEQDTLLLEDLYYRLLPWITGHPSRHLYDGDPLACPTCGGDSGFQRRGYYRTAAGKFPKIQCLDCHGYFRGTKREGKATTVRPVA